jgi:diguanylate cyclase (GGDEF)-like protein
MIAVTTGIMVVDFLSGPYVYLTVLYMGPILALQRYVSPRAAIALTLAVMLYRVTLYSTVWQSSGSGLAVAYWNLISEAGFIVLIVSLMARLRTALQAARALALQDPLTGAANRRAFYQQASTAIQRSHRSGAPLSIVYLDVDDFKRVNDRFGHQQGDRVLTTLAQSLQRAVRAGDLVVRLGGDEFAVLLPETGPDMARGLATRLRDGLQAAMTTSGLPATFSIGVLTFARPPASVDDLVARADALMYDAKQSGKNSLLFATVGAAA